MLTDQAPSGAMNIPGAGQIQITEIAIERTYNLGDYENQRVRVVLTIPPGESPERAYMIGEEFLAANHAETPGERRLRERREQEALRPAQIYRQAAPDLEAEDI
jgi:hypothetical protein